MATKVLVPRLGESVEEVTVTRWLKQVGDSVNELEPLLEVNTDKVDTEIPSPTSGTLLKLNLPEGTPAKVGQILAWIGKPGEQVPSDDEGIAAVQTQPQATPTKNATPTPLPTSAIPAPTSSAAHELGFISPVVAKMAAEHHLNLGQIPGTGLKGRITKKDVLAFIEREAAVDSRPTVSTAPSVTLDTRTGDTLIKHTIIRQQIAQHMLLSKRTSPHVLTVMEADLSQVVAHRQANQELFARDGVNLTFTAYFVAASVAALQAYPIVNSSWSDEGVLLHSAINIGIATSLGEQGLIVPVIKYADGLSLLGLARAVNDLAQRARAKELQLDEVKGGTFTITNHGVSGSLFAMPIINQPQCAILGVGAIQKQAVVINDAIAIRPMVYLSLTFDHRILDGASADWFLTKVKEMLESWS
jgi:2-oxoisovalerate dehydrogenase E2 component (dihydrolipoyl transacylase)